MSDTLRRKLNDSSAVAGIVGLGYVGLPLVQHLCKAGYRVVGFDVDENKIRMLEQGKSYIEHIPSKWIGEVVKAGKFSATSDFSKLKDVDCISICVPTPLNRHFEPDLKYVEATAKEICANLRKDQLIILESTTYPETTTELLVPLLEESGLKAGQDFHVSFSPEREDPGNPTFNISNIPKVVGGITPECTSLTAQYYNRIFDKVIEVSCPEVAELSKLLENIFRSVNIALVNELKMLCNRMGIDVCEVIDAAATKPFGFMPFYPGPGLGGHCIPIDPFYLSWKAREYDFSTRFIELAGQINTSMPKYVVTRVMEALNERGKTVKDAKVLILGVAYKKDVDDTRESPSFKLMELLEQHGAIISYNDPHVPVIPELRKYDYEMESVELTEENISQYDCVLVSTAHSKYDFDFIVEHSQLLVDTRNATRDVSKGREKIVKA